MLAASAIQAVRALTRRWGHALAATVFAAGLSATAHAFPNGTITIVVPFAAGGASDITGRVIAENLSDALGVPVIVENRAGANTQIATNHVIRSKPDGHTLLLGTTSLVNNVHLYPNLPYVASRDLRPVIGLVDVPVFLTVGPGLSVGSAKEFVQQAKASEGKWNFASAGAGSTLHLASEWLMDRVGFKAQHVPHRGSGPAVVALLGGEVQFNMENYGPAKAHIEGGRLKALAVASPQRFPALPDVPTFKEVGIGDVDLASWFVLMAPAQTPDDVVNRLNSLVNEILKRPAVSQRLIDLGLLPMGGTPEAMLARMQQDSGMWGSVIRSANVTVN